MNAAQIVNHMLREDAFSKWMGIALMDAQPGYCRLRFRIKPEMLNGFQKLHGGLLFSASDSALAFAANAHGNLSVAQEANISFLKPVQVGEELYVEAKEIHLGNKTGVYEIRTSRASGELVAFFKGTVYRYNRSAFPGIASPS